MSQPFPVSLPPFYLHLLLLVLLQEPLLPVAFSRGPRDAGRQMRGCTTLSVGHNNNQIHLESPRPAVEARLLNSSTLQPVKCYTPGAEHLVQLRVKGSTSLKIKGLIMSSKKACGRLGLAGDVLGQFSPQYPLRMWSSCPNTVTQDRVLGKTGVAAVSIPWKAPTMSSQSVTFVYSVVFSFHKWLERLHHIYPSCTPPCVMVAQDVDNNSSSVVGNHGNTTQDDEGLEYTSNECRPSFANENLVRCGPLQAFPKECSVRLGRVVAFQTPVRTRKFTRHHHPSSTLKCARTDCNC